MNSTPEQLRFASIPAHSVRADFAGGGLSSDLGPVLLRGIDLQIGLTARIAAALPDRRHQSYVNHSYHDILTQRIYQIGCGYGDGNDSNSLRHDPMFKLGAARLPFDDDAALASGPTISRFEHAARRQDIYRVSEALVEQFIASFSSPPKSLILDLDHHHFPDTHILVRGDGHFSGPELMA